MTTTRAFARLVLISTILSIPLIQASRADAAVCARTANGAEYESDFDGDHWNDLPIGVPYEDVGSIEDAGSLQVLYGSTLGLTGRDQVFTESSDSVPGTAESGDLFGSTTTTGDFDGDGYCDLAIGAPAEDERQATDSGRVWVLYGSSDGLTASQAQVFSQSTPGIAGSPGSGDRFGFSVAAGDFGNGAYTDLAIGAPGESVGAIGGAGQVHVLYGSRSGLRTANSDLVHQDTAGIKGGAEQDDHFGNVLAASNLIGSTHADVVIGIPHEDVGDTVDAGTVQYVAGGPNGLTSGDRYWTQHSAGISGVPEPAGRFGYSLALGNFGRSQARDLAIGAPGASVRIESTTYDNAGRVHVLYAGADGPAAPDELWTQSGANLSADSVSLQSSDHDLFGYRLAAGNSEVNAFNEVDLVVAVPYEDVHGTDDGVVVVFAGQDDGLAPVRAVDPVPSDEEEASDLTDQRFSFGGLFIREFGTLSGEAEGREDVSIGVMPKASADDGWNFVDLNLASDGDGSQYWRPVNPSLRGESEPGDRWGWVGSNALHDAIIPGEAPWE